MAKKYVEYGLGGLIGGGIGAVAGSFLGSPTLGYSLGTAAGSTIEGAVSEPRNKEAIGTIRKRGYASHGYRYGGKMKNYNTGGNLPTASMPIGAGAEKYMGPKHEQGGIPIDSTGNPDTQNPTAEVEGGETRQGNFIFSDSLKVPNTDMTFAEAHEKLIQSGADPQKIQQLQQLQERLKQEKGIETGGNNQNWGEKGAVKPKMDTGGYTVGDAEDEIIRQSKDYTTPTKPRFERGSLPTTSVTSATADKVPTQQGEGTDWLGVAGYVIPSAMRLGMASKSGKARKVSRMPERKVPMDTSPFREGKRRLASGFRANPDQASYANYTRGVNQLASQEANYKNRVREGNVRNAIRSDIYNTRIQGQNIERQAREDASKMQLVDQAVTGPLTAALADRRGKEQMIANLISSSDRISNPTDWARRVKVQLRAMGVPNSEIEQIIQQYSKDRTS